MDFKNKINCIFAGTSKYDVPTEFKVTNPHTRSDENCNKVNLEDHLSDSNITSANSATGKEKIPHLRKFTTNFKTNRLPKRFVCTKNKTTQNMAVMMVNKKQVNTHFAKDDVTRIIEKNDLLRRVSKIEEQLYKLVNRNK